MKNMFKPGDIVMCVNDVNSVNLLKKGNLYTISGYYGPIHCERTGTIQNAYHLFEIYGIWYQDRFTKLIINKNTIII